MDPAKTRIFNEAPPIHSVSTPTQPGAVGTSSISPFQWISLARATWTWIIRPLWNLCFVFPMKVVRYTMSGTPETAEDRRRRQEEDWYREENEKFFRKYSRW